MVRRDVDPAPEVDGSIGIDWGIASPATTTDPAFDLPYGGHRRRCAAELAKAQRKMSRRQRPRGQAPSSGYRDARHSKSKIEKHAARQVAHDTRIWAKRLVEHHQLIAIEDLKLKFLARSTMARKAADIGLGQARRELVDRAVRAGRTVVIVTPAYTTMTCSRCFAKAKQRLGLAERIFLCRECGYTDSRDRNAARTILAVAERGGTCVDDVRHALASSPGVAGVARSELEIPRL